MTTFQLLQFLIEVSYDDERLDFVLAYLANNAEQPVAPTTVLPYAVAGRGPYELSAGGEHLATAASPDDVLYLLYGRCHSRLVENLMSHGWVPLHGGIVGLGGRRVLVLGPKGAGKTTLMLRLLYDGHRVEGDEMVFTRDGEAVCLPRNFHVKAGTRQLVPELSTRWASLPKTSTSDGRVIAGFNPAAAGAPWRVLQGPVDVALVLRGDHARTSAVRPLTNVELVETAMGNCFGGSVDRRTVVRACARLLGRVEGYEVTVGDLRSAADLVLAAARQASPCYDASPTGEVRGG